MIERAQFGRTGHASSRVIFGAAGLGRASQERADQALEVLDEFGVNHIDTAASYGDSELRIAPWMRTRRGDFFLATKTGDRSGPAARASLERSLERLGVDHVDLVQLHNLVEEDEWQEAHAPGGAVEALAAAREEGLTRFVGVTGHGLRIAGMHLRSLERFDFDSVLLPYSHLLLVNDDYRATVEQLLGVCQERGVAVQTIKAVARRRWQPDATARRFSWYEPLPEGEALARAVQWVLADRQVFLNSSSDLGLLRPTLAAAAAGGRPDPERLARDRDEQSMDPLFDGGALERI